MKKIAIAMLLLAASTTLFACGPSNPTNENTNPEEVRGETLSEKDWEEVFSERTNYSVKSKVCMRTGNGGTMSEVATYLYTRDGDIARVQLKMSGEGTDAGESEVFLRYGEQITMWERAKEDGTWGEWQSEDYPPADFGYIDGMCGNLTCLKEEYRDFSYDETERGYVAAGEKLQPLAETLSFRYTTLLAVAEDAVPVKAVVKAQGKKPSACILDFETGTEDVRIRAPFRITKIRVTLPRLRGCGNLRPELTFGVPLPLRVAEVESKQKVQISQIFYDYGSSEVTLPAELKTTE